MKLFKLAILVPLVPAVLCGPNEEFNARLIQLMNDARRQAGIGPVCFDP